MSQTKKIIFVALAVIVVVTWESFSDLFTSYPIVNFPPKSEVILAWGDSLTTGVGATSPEFGYLEVLQSRLSASTTNRAVGGETSADTLLHAEKDMTEVQPGIVLILIGGNDLLSGVPAGDTLLHVRTLIETAQKQKAVVYLVGFQKSQGDAYAVGFEKLAKEMGAVYTGDILGGIIGNSTLMSDEVHPNNKGYLKMADKIAPTLESLILSAPKGN